jgi:hypothetical protein
MSSLRCNTCALLSKPELSAHASHYFKCNWVPTEPVPSNVFGWELSRLTDQAQHNEQNRWIPKKQIELADLEDAGKDIGDSHCLLRPCRAHVAKP